MLDIPVNEMPMLTNTNYIMWRNEMERLMKSIDYDLWTVVRDGDFKIQQEHEGKKIEKPISEWTESDKRLFQKNARALCMISIGISESAKRWFLVLNYRTAKEAWDSLRQSHEVTKKFRIREVIEQYERFEMGPGEKVSETVERFDGILRGMRELGVCTYPNFIVLGKLMENLSQRWFSFAMDMVTRDVLDEMSLEELRWRLEKHERFMDSRATRGRDL